MIYYFQRLGVILESRLVWAAIFIGFFAYFAVRLGTDGTPDFKIYHYYNGYAALSDRSGLDLVPAQMQTFLFPGLDAAYYLLFRGLNSHPTLLNIVLSLPYAIAAFLVLIIGENIIPSDWPWRRTTVGIAALYGLTGAGGLPTLATTMSDVVPGVFVLVALLIWLRLERLRKNTNGTIALVGAVAGFSVALKLTIAPLFGALGVVIFLAGLKRPSRSSIMLVSYGIAGIIVVLLVDGPWLLHNYTAYGNPLFPSFNHIFKSDFAVHMPWIDTRFRPQTVLMALFYPAYWAFAPSHHAIELSMQDPRIALGLVSAGAMIVATLMRNHSNKSELSDFDGIPLWSLAVFFIVGYLLWEFIFSIFRYLMVLECLSGVMVLGALRAWSGIRFKPVWAVTVFCVTLSSSAIVTKYPWWSRAAPAGQAVQIKLPMVEADAMVIFLDGYAYSYLVPSLPNTVRAIGANNTIARPELWGKLQQQVEAAINGHRGPFWGLEDPQDFPNVADQTLSHYRLTRGGDCTFIETNIDDRTRMRMCRLMRQ